MASQPQFINVPNNQFTSFTDADGTTAKTVFTTAASGGAMLRSLLITTDNASNVNVRLTLLRGGVSYTLATIEVPANAGYDSDVSPVNLVDPFLLPIVDPAPNRAILMEANDELQLAPTVALEAGKTLHVSAFAGDY